MGGGFGGFWFYLRVLVLVLWCLAGGFGGLQRCSLPPHPLTTPPYPQTLPPPNHQGVLDVREYPTFDPDSEMGVLANAEEDNEEEFEVRRRILGGC